MPGFRHCSWCSGKGCIACDGEKAKWEKKEKDRLEAEAKKDPREKLRELESPLLRAITMAMGDGAVAALDREIEAAKAACDAEYRRQFPNGPTPIFTARRDNAGDMDLLKQVFRKDALTRAFSEGGGGMEEVLAGAEVARGKQEPPIEYKPIGSEPRG